MRTFTKVASAAILPAVLVLAGCGGAKPAEAPAAQAPAAQPAPVQQQPATPASTPAPAATPGVVEISIKLVDHQIEPKVLNIPLGSKVKLTLTNAGEKKHDFTIEGAYKIESELLSPGATQTLEFVADKAGQFKIVCTQRGHAEKGMEGVLEVK